MIKEPTCKKAPTNPNFIKTFVLPLAINTEPVVLRTDCIIAVGANHCKTSAAICHCGPKTIDIKGRLRIAIPLIRGHVKTRITRTQLRYVSLILLLSS